MNSLPFPADLDSPSRGRYTVDDDDWPLCPCCVAQDLGIDPQTDECIAEAGEEGPAPTPSPTSASRDLT